MAIEDRFDKFEKKIDDRLDKFDNKIDDLKKQLADLCQIQAVQCAHYEQCRMQQAEHHLSLYGGGDESKGLTYRMGRSETRWWTLMKIVTIMGALFTLTLAGAITGFFKWLADKI